MKSPAVFVMKKRVLLEMEGGDHKSDNTQETRRTDQCHDMAVFPTRNIARACSGNGILFDISDPHNLKELMW